MKLINAGRRHAPLEAAMDIVTVLPVDIVIIASQCMREFELLRIQFARADGEIVVSQQHERPVRLFQRWSRVTFDDLAIHDRRHGIEMFVAPTLHPVRVAEDEITVVDLEQRQTRRVARRKRAHMLIDLHHSGRIDSHALYDLRQRQAVIEKDGHDVTQRMRRSGDVYAL